MQASEIRTNLLSGLTVAFALVAHVSPLRGLYAAFIVALITSAFGGRPGMVSGTTGVLVLVLVLVLVSLVATHGVQYLFAAGVLMGIFQITFGLARLGKFIRIVPHPVMLAIVDFKTQFGHFKIMGADGVQRWMGGAPWSYADQVAMVH